MADQSWTDYNADTNLELVPYAERRADLLLEQLFTADSSGNYTSNWISSAGVNTVRITADFLDDAETPTMNVEEAQRDSSSSPRILRTEAMTVGGGDRVRQDVELGTRVFRLKFSSMGNARSVAVTVRSVS